MATRFMNKALVTAALGIALSLLLAATPTVSPARGSTAGAPQLDPPAAPSHCKTGHFRIVGIFGGTFYYVQWRDNSTNEDGFTVEHWWRNQSGVWVLNWSVNREANSTGVGLAGKPGPNDKFRVKAFNAAGESAWSNWGH